jgi:FkbM family methyltransferase
VYGDYEGAGFLSWCRATLPADAVVVDSGANIGQVTLYLAPHLSGGQLFAFEPGTHARAWLEECLQRHPGWPVEVVPAALGRERGTLFLADAGPEHTVGSWSKISESEGQPTPVIPLDDVLEERAIRRVHLWKLDMEGWEPEALAGAQRSLAAGRIDCLYVELSPKTRSPIHQLLRSFGYQGFIFGGWGNRKLLPAVEHNEDLDYALFLKPGGKSSASP